MNSIPYFKNGMYPQPTADVTGDGIVTGSDVLEAQSQFGWLGATDWFNDPSKYSHASYRINYTANGGEVTHYLYHSAENPVEPGLWDAYALSEIRYARGAYPTGTTWTVHCVAFADPSAGWQAIDLSHTLIAPVIVWKEDPVTDPHDQYDTARIAIKGKFTIPADMLDPDRPGSIRFTAYPDPRDAGMRVNNYGRYRMSV